MRRDCLVLAVLVAGYVCLLPPLPPATADKGAPDANKPAPEGPHFAERPQNGNPEIRFEEIIYDFGEVSPGTKNLCEFKFTNTGDGLLKITKVTKTCGCTPYTLQRTEYAPGENGTLKVRYNAGKRPGSIRKHLFVHSNDKARPKVELTIKARIAQNVEYEPKRLRLSLKAEDAASTEITLRSLDNKPFSIKQFKSTADCITADVNSSLKSTEFVLEARVDVEKLKKHLKGRIDIKLTHPECDTVAIPFSALPEFRVDPPAIIVLNARPAEPVYKQVWVLSNYDENFEIESVSSRKGIIEPVGQEKLGSRYKFDLKITPPAGAGRKIFTDVLFINIKGAEKLQITCRGFYKKTGG